MHPAAPEAQQQPAPQQAAWHCFQTLPKKERMAASFVRERAGLECYCPHIRYFKKTRRGRVRFNEALFPGYMFVRCDIRNDLRLVLSMQGIRKAVSYGNHHPVIPDTLIAEMQAQMGGELYDVPDTELGSGTEVVVVQGPFADFNAVVNGQLPGRARVHVLLEFLGRQIVVAIPSGHLMAAKEDPKAGLFRPA